MNTAFYSTSAQVHSSHLLLVSDFVLPLTFVLIPYGNWTGQLSCAKVSSAYGAVRVRQWVFKVRICVASKPNWQYL